MVSVALFLAWTPFFGLLSGAAQPAEISPGEQTANWQAPIFWTPPVARNPRDARSEAVNTAPETVSRLRPSLI